MVKKKTLVPLSGYIPTNQVINPKDIINPNSLSTTQSILTYNYGEDISRWAVIPPFTLNHDQTNSILTLFDNDSTTFYQLSGNAAGSKITTIILDFGKTLQIRGFILSFSFDAAAAASKTVDSQYSIDGSTYQTIASTTNDGTLKFYDHLGVISAVRYIKITLTSSSIGNTTKFYQLMTIV